MLPDSPNQIVDTISPLEPATINDLQDCVVGFRTGAIAMARGEGTMVLTAMAFQHQFNTDATSLPTPAPGGSSTLWTFFTGIFACVPLPAGHRIKKVVYRANRNSATGSANGSLNLFNDANDTGLSLSTIAVAPTPGVTTAQNYETPAINYTIQPGDGLQLGIIQAANNALRFHRATIYFDVPLP